MSYKCTNSYLRDIHADTRKGHAYCHQADPALYARIQQFSTESIEGKLHDVGILIEVPYGQLDIIIIHTRAEGYFI